MTITISRGLSATAGSREMGPSPRVTTMRMYQSARAVDTAAVARVRRTASSSSAGVGNVSNPIRSADACSRQR